MIRRVAGPLVAAAAALGCAQPGTPPGGEVDRAPPRVVAVTPEPFDTLTDRDAPVVIRFDERISERFDGVAALDRAVLVSPATSPVRAERKRRSIEVSLLRGWEPGRAYTVVVLPVFRDLFGNRRVEPVELVFSTGGPVPAAALAGFVTDRLTAEPVEGARVEAVRAQDSTAWVAATDSAGFFAIRHLPDADYLIRAWNDQNADRIVDFFEARDSVDATLAEADTAVIELAVLPGDSTPARLVTAEPVDSTLVRLLFDDHFAPGPVSADARLYRLEDSALVGRGSLLHGSRLDSLSAARAAAADSAAAAAADTLPSDSATAPVEAAPDEAAETAPPTQVERRRAERPPSEERPLLPSRELLFIPPGPLVPGGAYYVVVDGATNIHGLPGGGGSAGFTAPEAPDDSAGAALPAEADPGGAPR